jgi:dihydrolipoamide dehydrogenase
MSQVVYDVIVLGGGAGGVPAAIRAAQLGGKVGLIEREHLGGFCMNRGCVPFGHMMAASRILGGISLGKEMGLSLSVVTKDFKALKRRHNELIAFMRQGVIGMLKKNHVDIIRGDGRLVEKGKIEAGGRLFQAENVILASGSTWLKPDFPGADLKEVITSDALLNGEELPKRVLLFGRSPWLIQIAQFLHRFDSEVILATREKSILSDESKVVRSRLAKVLSEEGVKILTSTEIMGITKKKDGLFCDLSRKDGEHAVVVDRVIALNRGAALSHLGLDRVGLDDSAPFIAVDHRMGTGVGGIYAIGDIAAPETRHYSHLASEGGIIAAENIAGLNSSFDSRTVTRVLFTQPQVACIGLTGKDAKKRGYDVVTGSAPLSMNTFGMLISQNNGIVEVVAEKEYGEILGIHLIGEGASEMAGQAVLAIQMEATLEELARSTFPHPTLSESMAEAARECLDRPIFLP